ncbi:hypothetical protein G9A89_000273 [Geosiphon pyriformis]|nr:hypothetical protein G9A89_000273 [Geosiphon pyriformis]
MGLLFGLALSVFLVAHGLRKKSLSHSGAVAAFFVGMGTTYNEWAVFPILMLVFYFTGSRLTKLKAQRKKEIEEEYQDGGQRNAVQVFSNALWGTSVAIWHQYQFGGEIQCLFDNPSAAKLFLVYLGHYATCNGDTWASEIGVLNKNWPYLITNLKKVPPGTNGGITALGLGASLSGGLLIGISAVASIGLASGCNRWWWELIPIAGFAGLIGSIVDSILGATVQKTLYSLTSKKITSHLNKDVRVVSGWDLLDNNQVNFISSFITSLLTAYISIDLLKVI